jgi:hypothetical protein
MSDRERNRREAMRAAEETGMDPAVIAAGTSVLLSLYYYFVRGKRELGTFVGLWPPTILAFASYFEQTRMSERLKRATDEESSLRGSVQRIMEGR